MRADSAAAASFTSAFCFAARCSYSPFCSCVRIFHCEPMMRLMSPKEQSGLASTTDFANLAGKDDIASDQPLWASVEHRRLLLLHLSCRLHNLRHHIRVLLQHQRPPEEVHLILDDAIVLADKLRQPLRRQRLKALLVLQVANLADVDVLLQKLRRALHNVVGHAENGTSLADAQQRIGVLDAAEEDLLRVKGTDGVGRKFRLLDEPGPVKVRVARLIRPHAVNAADEVPFLVGADVAAVADAEGARRDGELLVVGPAVGTPPSTPSFTSPSMPTSSSSSVFTSAEPSPVAMP
ncbi:hypothetical protein TYRP_017593 [Tyrophagus putrescentiae]|nr:hypothetical protein TYRP_017593 [Tyrophagus putrescentiae]